MSEVNEEKSPMLANSSEDKGHQTAPEPNDASTTEQASNMTNFEEPPVAAAPDSQASEPEQPAENSPPGAVQDKEDNQMQPPASSGSIDNPDKTEASPSEVVIMRDSSPAPESTPSSPQSGEKPVKPPRMKSFRGSKESPPEIRVTPVVAAPVTAAPSDAATADPQDVEAGGDAETSLLGKTPATAAKEDAVKPKRKFGLDYIVGNKWVVLGIIAVIIVILILLIVGVTVSRKPPVKEEVKSYPAPIVNNLRCGRAEGTWEEDYSVAVFKGIPYLKPPVGDLRWKYDDLLIKSDDINFCHNNKSDIKADEFRGPCFQSNPAGGNAEPYIGEEDCLYLNVWTPNIAADPEEDRPSKDPLPVLVYIHGGFLHYGSGHDETSPSAQLARDLNAVVVSFNYRLNVFGWLALEGLTGATSQTGNYGLFDIIQALKWVNQYIAAFGGDPSKVTLAGISSGGTVVYPLLANDDARGLFQRAWLSGASSKFDKDLSKTEADNQVFLKNYGCDGPGDVRDCLLKKTAKELVDGIPWIQYPAWDAAAILDMPQKDQFIGAVIVNDGTYVVENPGQVLPTKNLNVAMIIGNNEYETDRYQVTDVSHWNWARYADYVRSKMDTFGGNISEVALSKHSELKDDPRLHFSRVVSDIRAICPQTQWTEVIANQNDASVYRYVLTAPAPQEVGDKWLGGSRVATHATDFVFFFQYNETDSSEYKELKSRFRNQIKEFMKTGKVTNWVEYPIVMKLTDSKEDQTDMWNKEYCHSWKDFSPDYAWMN